MGQKNVLCFLTFALFAVGTLGQQQQESFEQQQEISCPAVDFEHEIVGDGNNFHINFLPEDEVEWVDVHYRIVGRMNENELINERMAVVGEGFQNSLSIPLNPGEELNFFFTYCTMINGQQIDCDTDTLSLVLPAEFIQKDAQQFLEEEEQQQQFQEKEEEPQELIEEEEEEDEEVEEEEEDFGIEDFAEPEAMVDSGAYSKKGYEQDDYSSKKGYGKTKKYKTKKYKSKDYGSKGQYDSKKGYGKTKKYKTKKYGHKKKDYGSKGQDYQQDYQQDYSSKKGYGKKKGHGGYKKKGKYDTQSYQQDQQYEEQYQPQYQDQNSGAAPLGLESENFGLETEPEMPVGEVPMFARAGVQFSSGGGYKYAYGKDKYKKVKYPKEKYPKYPKYPKEKKEKYPKYPKYPKEKKEKYPKYPKYPKEKKVKYPKYPQYPKEKKEKYKKVKYPTPYPYPTYVPGHA